MIYKTPKEKKNLPTKIVISDFFLGGRNNNPSSLQSLVQTFKPNWKSRKASFCSAITRHTSQRCQGRKPALKVCLEQEDSFRKRFSSSSLAVVSWAGEEQNQLELRDGSGKSIFTYTGRFQGQNKKERQQEKGPHAGFKLEDGSTCLLATGAITELEGDVNCTIYWMRALTLDSHWLYSSSSSVNSFSHLGQGILLLHISVNS